MKKVERKIQKFSAKDMAVGRLATQVALALRGKTKPEYEPQWDLGDIVEVSDIKFLKFTGKKLDQKRYYHYSGYQSGLRTKKMSEVLAKDPGEVLRRAVRDMLPATKLRVGMLKRLIIK